VFHAFSLRLSQGFQACLLPGLTFLGSLSRGHLLLLLLLDGDSVPLLVPFFSAPEPRFDDLDREVPAEFGLAVSADRGLGSVEIAAVGTQVLAGIKLVATFPADQRILALEPVRCRTAVGARGWLCHRVSLLTCR
jgi:hypothetical protein